MAIPQLDIDLKWTDFVDVLWRNVGQARWHLNEGNQENNVAFIALSVVVVVLVGFFYRQENKPDEPYDQTHRGLYDLDISSGEPWVPDRSEGSVTSQRDKMRALFKECRGDEEKAVLAYATAERAGEVSRKSNDYALNAEEYARRLFADGVRKGWIT